MTMLTPAEARKRAGAVAMQAMTEHVDYCLARGHTNFIDDLIERVTEKTAAVLLQAQREAVEALDRDIWQYLGKWTAEDPNESAYERGKFDGLIEFEKRIRALLPDPAQQGRDE